MNEWTDKRIYGTLGSKFENVAGKVLKGRRTCSMHGCTGLRIHVKWPDGKSTWPCSKAIVVEADHLRIQ